MVRRTHFAGLGRPTGIPKKVFLEFWGVKSVGGGQPFRRNGSSLTSLRSAGLKDVVPQKRISSVALW